MRMCLEYPLVEKPLSCPTAKGKGSRGRVHERGRRAGWGDELLSSPTAGERGGGAAGTGRRGGGDA